MTTTMLRILGILVAIGAAIVVWLILHKKFPDTWRFLVLLARNRYCLVMILGPALLALLAMVGPVRSLLHGLTILRDGEAIIAKTDLLRSGQCHLPRSWRGGDGK